MEDTQVHRLYELADPAPPCQPPRRRAPRFDSSPFSFGPVNSGVAYFPRPVTLWMWNINGSVYIDALSRTNDLGRGRRAGRVAAPPPTPLTHGLRATPAPERYQ